MPEIDYIFSASAGQAQVLTSELMGHFRPVFARMIPLAMRAHASRGFYSF